MMYGFVGTMYFIFHDLLTGKRTLTPNHCSGPRCNDILTCHAARDASYHVLQSVLILGGTIFGAIGCNGCAQGSQKELNLFWGFLIGLIAILIGLDVYDTLYVNICNEFPYRIIEETLLWPLYDAPVAESVKREIRLAMHEYPVEYITVLTRVNIMVVLYMIEVPVILFLAYVAYSVGLVTEYSVQGVFGLGPNFSLKDWRQRNEALEHSTHLLNEVKARATKTVKDVAWRPIEKVKKEFGSDFDALTSELPNSAKFLSQEAHQASLYLPDPTTQIGSAMRFVNDLPDNPFNIRKGSRAPPNGASASSGYGATGAP